MMDIQDPYVAYCFDEAVNYFGSKIESELDKAGDKPSKSQRKTEAARKRVLDKFLGVEQSDSQKFAAPPMI